MVKLSSVSFLQRGPGVFPHILSLSNQNITRVFDQSKVGKNNCGVHRKNNDVVILGKLLDQIIITIIIMSSSSSRRSRSSNIH